MTGSKPQRLGPYLLPPHTPVAIPLFAIHNTQHNWDAPHEFRPERWLQVCKHCLPYSFLCMLSV